MSATNLKVRSGNRVKLLYDGVAVGLIQSQRMSDDYGHEPASGIGDIHVQEWVPGMARHSISVSEMVLFVGALAQSGLVAENGDAVLQGTVFDIVVQSRDDGSILRKYVNVSYVSGDSEVSKHAIIVSNATFNALDKKGIGI